MNLINDKPMAAAEKIIWSEETSEAKSLPAHYLARAFDLVTLT